MIDVSKEVCAYCLASKKNRTNPTFASIGVGSNGRLYLCEEHFKELRDSINVAYTEWFGCPETSDIEDKPVNVYGCTDYYWCGEVTECIRDGYGYKDDSGHITWYDGYEPINDEYHVTTITPCAAGGEQ